MNNVIRKIQLVLVVIVISSFTAFSQNTNEKQQSYQVGNKQVDIQKKDAQLAPVHYVNEDDIYQGRQKEILNNLTVRVIPDDFPKYQKGKGIKWYNEQMDNYYKTHPMIITEMVRKKLLGN
jgi:hypothetical protein